MLINWKKFTFGALLLASLSLLLVGCGDFGGAPKAVVPVAKNISGIVSDSGTGLPLANATVTAYAIDTNGVQATTPLSMNPVSVKSAADGSFALKIPIDYEGPVMLEASPSLLKAAVNSLKQVSLTTGQKVRALLPKILKAQTDIPPAMISLATEMAVVYIEQNKHDGFRSDNIQTATLVLEKFFGPNFAQTPPPSGDAVGTKAQQDLLVMIQAFNSLNVGLDECVAIDPVTQTLGVGEYAAQLSAAINNVIVILVQDNVLPPSYLPDATITMAITQSETAQVIEPDLTDKTPPTAPDGLALSSLPTATSVALSWTASTDNVAVTAYIIYRNGVAISTVSAPGFTDTSVTAATNYEYEVKARDAVGNTSAGSKIAVITADIASATYVMSGKVTFNGSGLAGAIVSITGAGFSSITTNDGGNYTFAGVRNGEYTVTPNVAGFTFTPASYTVTVNNGNISVPDFTAAAMPATSFTISGKVSFNGAGVAGVTVAITGAGSNTLVTDGSGTYAFTGVINGNYTITPSRTGYSFTPTSRPFTVSNANKPGQDFAATLPGSATGGVTYPDGSVTGVVTYPNGTVIGGVTFPPGTIVGGITYPTGTVIGGVTYPTATVIGGVTYPTGTVIGGITYPNGVVIGGVTYPPGTVVGGVAFPVGAVTTGITYPSGVVIGGVIYPSGSVTGGVTYPGGTVTGGVTYPSGVVIGGVTYPSGSVTGGVTYPSGSVTGGVTYPSGSVTGGVTYPSGTVIGGVTYPPGAVIGWVTYPSGSVTGGVTYPNGTVIGGITYPPGTIIGGVTYPTGVVIGGVTYPTATVIGGVTYPTGTVIGGVTYPNGVVIGGVTYPPGTVVGGVAFPVGAVTTGVTYPSGTVIGGVTYPSGTVTGGVTYPGGSVTGGVTYPSGVVIGGVTYPSGSVTGGVAFPTGSITAGLLFP